jgi:hypothetical protein
MSHINSTARRAVVGLGAVTGGVLAAAFIGVGAASADTDGYSDLFGAIGTTGYPATAGADNAALDAELLAQNPGDATAFDISVDQFEANNDHAIENIIYAIDPSAYVHQIDPDIVGTFSDGSYLVPDDALGYLGTSLDYFLLTPTGLDYLLSPVAELLLGSPPF